MSERANSPRLGGRNADGRRSDARGARHFSGDDSDTRRSGIRGDSEQTRRASRETGVPRERLRDDDSVRAERRATDDGRTDRRSGADLARGKGRRPEPMIGKSRSEAARKRDTGPIEGGKSATVTVQQAGTYPYICKIHNTMKGTVVVR